MLFHKTKQYNSIYKCSITFSISSIGQGKPKLQKQENIINIIGLRFFANDIYILTDNGEFGEIFCSPM